MFACDMKAWWIPACCRYSPMTKQDLAGEGPTQASEFEVLRESLVFEGSELTFTPRGSPDARLMRLVRLRAQQAARECYEVELRLTREKRRKAPPGLNAGQRRSAVPLFAQYNDALPWPLTGNRAHHEHAVFYIHCRHDDFSTSVIDFRHDARIRIFDTGP
jgi:hypothetical protein